MTDYNDELNEKEKLEQENFLLKSKIIIKGGDFQKFSDIDPEIENQFLKNIMAFEEGEVKPVHEIWSQEELKAEIKRREIEENC